MTAGPTTDATDAAGPPGTAAADAPSTGSVAASVAGRPSRGMLVRIVLALAAGACLFLTFPPASLWWLGPIGVATLVVATRGLGLPGAAATGYVAGLAYYVPLVAWTGTAVGTLPWLLLAAGCALFWAVLGLGLSVVGRMRWAPLWIALVWVSVEAVQSRVGFGGFPWGRLAFGQTDGPFLGLAALGGAPAVTFATALTGGLLAAAVLALPGAPRAVWAAATVGAVALGMVLPPGLVTGDTPASGTVTVALVQGNVPRLGLDFNAQAEAVLRNHVTATTALADAVAAGREPRPDLVIWPENAVDVDPFRHPSAGRLVSQAAEAIGAPLLVGAILDGPTPTTRRNVSIVWDPVTGPGAVYDKRRPAPFAEYLPLRRLATAVSDKAELVGRDVVAGGRPGVLTVGPATVGVTICYELAFDSLVRDLTTAGPEGGAQVLVLQNNSATFGRSAESRQQLAQAQLRAVEHDRTALAVTTSGVSAVVTPEGAVTRSTGIFTSAVVVAQVPLRETVTPAVRLGAWPEVIAGAVLVLALAAAWVRAPVRARGRVR